MKNSELESLINEKLNSTSFSDYGPNGLQVEGRETVQKIITGVTASQALLDEAVRQNADAVIVHHGYFWKNESPIIRGMKRNRLKTLLANDINLYGYHLPLDAHPELGNNAQLARLMGWLPEGRFGEQDIGWTGRLAEGESLDALARGAAARLGREPLMLGDPGRRIERIAWCTGGAQGYFEQAIAQGVDCFVSGEASEPTTHLARESGVAYLGIGHHASERYGVKALGAHLAAAFGIEAEFVEVDNPV